MEVNPITTNPFIHTHNHNFIKNSTLKITIIYNLTNNYNNFQFSVITPNSDALFFQKIIQIKFNGEL